LAAYAALAADLTPSPKLTVQAPTPASIQADIIHERKLRQYVIAEKAALSVFRRHAQCNQFAGLVGERSVETGLPARILAAVAIVESSCNPNAVSPTGDYGLFQVNAKAHHVSPKVLLDPAKNARIASEFLRALIRQYGAVEGLHRYNGLGNPTNAYADRVFQVAGYKS